MNPNDPNVDTYDSTIIYGDVNLTWQAFPLEGKRRPLMTPVSPSVGQGTDWPILRFAATKFFLLGEINQSSFLGTSHENILNAVN